MYGRADGMPSFQLTVAVRGRNALITRYSSASTLIPQDRNRKLLKSKLVAKDQYSQNK